jgi:DNA excision repair protein ERCC-2
MNIKASVKEIVEQIYGSGDLISQTKLMKRAEEGTLIHRHHQSKYKNNDQSEVYVKFELVNDDYTLFISGRIDGVIIRNKKTIIEEIKSTTKDLDVIDENTSPAHFAQAKMYAYLYNLESTKKEIYVRLTYIHVATNKIKILDFTFTNHELKEFFDKTVNEYINWIKVIDNHETNRNKSIEGLAFPFAQYRYGQRELMGACYKTLLNKDIVYAIAPTGVGKTIATIFSSLKAINQNEQKVFYLTAKNMGKKVAIDTIKLLMSKGLVTKTIEITAKDQICFQEVRDCDPEKCPYSKGYYNRIYKAVQDIYDNEDLFSKEVISEYALKHNVCPFEFSLDASYYADIIICDYNYAFCPLTHLIRYFDDETQYAPILLVDEAHNLVSRSREMYSGSITKIKILTLAKYAKENKWNIAHELKEVLNIINLYEEKLKQVNYIVIDFDNDFNVSIDKLYHKIESLLEDKKVINNKNEIIKILLELYRFNKSAEYFDTDFVYTIEKTDIDIIININCLDASKYILKTLKERTVGSIFFSATLYPIEYYKNLLTQNEGKFIQIPSPFDPDNLNLINVDDVSTRYKDRINSIDKIIDLIDILGNSKIGNYIIFFPSYQYLSMVSNALEERNFDFEYIIQKRDFTTKEREDVINLFNKNDKTQIALFVMGGMFSEGIDYIGDMLSGVIIVGTGLPMYGGYNNIIKGHFDNKFNNGFDYAYTYPGFNKVIQAVGRVIRTETDRGIAILIDDRFSTNKYQQLYPNEWYHMKRISNVDIIQIDINNFWNIKK